MTPPSTPAPNPFDPARLRLPARASGVVATRPRLPRHRRGEAFLRGPIPYAWVSTACRLPGSGLHVALGVRFLRGRYGRIERWSIGEVAVGLGLSKSTTRRGLHAAEEAGLVIATREPGCKPSLAIDPTVRDGTPNRPPLYGPIPASWLLPALKLLGPALQVAMACWLIAGRARAPAFELALGEWGELGLSRQAAARGLDSLCSAGLVSVSPRPGRSPVVMLVGQVPPPTVAMAAVQAGAGGPAGGFGALAIEPAGSRACDVICQ